MTSIDHQPSPAPPRCNASKLAGNEASFRHWHFGDRAGARGAAPLYELKGGVRASPTERFTKDLTSKVHLATLLHPCTYPHD